jgi:hypothetical protein
MGRPYGAILCAAVIAIATAALAGDLPDPRLTPGAVLTTDLATVCIPGYAASVRYVTPETKRFVYAEYGIASHQPGEYEVDHLISLELGGSNDIANLWPESHWTEPWNAHVKDRLENRLHELVCEGRLSLSEAQRAIAIDWIETSSKAGKILNRAAAPQALEM